MKDQVAILVISETEEWLPLYASKEAAGADVRAAISVPIELAPGQRLLIPTGLTFQIPVGYEVQVRPRSGLALKHGITVLNSPGTIDSDYRGPIQVLLINLGTVPFVIEPAMRIAQIVVAPIVQAHFVTAETLITTERGKGGFGHTGL